MSQGKIAPLIAASEARERERVDALGDRVSVLVGDVRELVRRVDELAGELRVCIGELRKDRGNGGIP